MKDGLTSIDRLDGTKGYKLQNTQDVQDTVVEEFLDFKLTEDDFAEKGKEAGRTSGELSQLENQFDTVKKDWKEKIENKEGELSVILRTIRAGTEKRKVKCIKQKDFQAHMVRWIFDGQVMHERAMELNERQMELVKTKTLGQVQGEVNEKEAMKAQMASGDPKARELREVMREETNKKTKKDLSTGH